MGLGRRASREDCERRDRTLEEVLDRIARFFLLGHLVRGSVGPRIQYQRPRGALLALEMVLDMRQPGRRAVANLGSGGKHCLQPL